MSVVACPACGGKVSRAAASCPHCGHPMTASPAANVTVPGPPTHEEVLWEGVPSLKSMWAPILGAVVTTTALVVFAYLSYRPLLGVLGGVSKDLKRSLAQGEPGVRLAVILVIAGLVVVRLVRLGWQILVLRSHHYRVSNQRILIESGVFTKRIDEVDMRTVEDIDFEQSFVQRLLRIGTIRLIGSDRTAARFTLMGVENPRDVRELIRASAYQSTRGQLFTRTT